MKNYFIYIYANTETKIYCRLVFLIGENGFDETFVKAEITKRGLGYIFYDKQLGIENYEEANNFVKENRLSFIDQFRIKL